MDRSNRPTATTQGLLLGVALLAALTFVLLALAVAAGPLAIDLTVAESLRPARFGITGVIFDALNLLGQALVWDPLVLGIAVVLWWRGLRFEAVVLILGVIGAEAGASVAKIFVNLARPPGIGVTDLITQASYPSGHMTRAVVTGGLLVPIAWRKPRWRIPAIATAVLLAVLMGAARIAFGEHWFTDVVGAALFGLFALAGVGLIAPRIHPAFERRFGGPLGP